jgi:tryptophan 2,3-dioxygenase
MKYPPVQYHDYLQLNKILDAQFLQSEKYNQKAHDEMLFITVHQAYELWFKQILFELNSVLAGFSAEQVSENSMGQMVARMERIVSILKLILGQIDVLETMTPLDFLDFREFLYPASGFQSFQWRLIETKLGLRIEDRLQLNNSPFYNYLKDEQKNEMMTTLSQPSLFEQLDKWLSRTPFLQSNTFNFWQSYSKAVEQMLDEDSDVVKKNQRLSVEDRDKNLAMIEGSRKTFRAITEAEAFAELQKNGHFRLTHRAVQGALLINLFRDEPALQLPFRFLHSLLDIDEVMTQWRYRHALMAHRMLGKKIGTGGTSGHDYLKSATEKHKIFGDLFNLSTFLIPRSRLPILPEDVRQKMNFSFN